MSNFDYQTEHDALVAWGKALKLGERSEQLLPLPQSKGKKLGMVWNEEEKIYRKTVIVDKPIQQKKITIKFQDHTITFIEPA